MSVVPGPRRILTTDLWQNNPNPFTGSTTVEYELARHTRLTLKVFDVQGAEVATLFDGEQDAGRYAVTWTGVDDRGHGLGAGIYFCHLTAGDVTRTRKILIRR